MTMDGSTSDKLGGRVSPSTRVLQVGDYIVAVPVDRRLTVYASLSSRLFTSLITKCLDVSVTKKATAE